MKDKLVKGIRGLLPAGAIRRLEEGYRKSRVKLATAKYGHPARNLSIIAITGTNGKTTTACYLNEIFKAAGKTTALFTTAVIEINGQKELNKLNRTVALTGQLLKFLRDAKRARVDHVILEVTSHALEQHKFDTTPVECAIMTNLTQDHLDYHKTMENYADAKGLLFAKKPKFIVLNRDDDWYDRFAKYPAAQNTMTYGTSKKADCRISSVKLYKKGSEAELVFDTQTNLMLATALPGKFNVYNLAAAATAAYLYQIPLSAIAEGVTNLETVPGRFERPVTDKPYEVVVDYAHTPDALEKLLESIKDMTKKRVLLVFGACGDRDKGKRPIMGEIAARLADRIFLTDEESYNEDPAAIRAMVFEGIKKGHGAIRTEEIEDRYEAIKKALSEARTGDTVVITGMGHEQFRIVKGERVPWNDSEVVREILQK